MFDSIVKKESSDIDKRLVKSEAARKNFLEALTAIDDIKATAQEHKKELATIQNLVVEIGKERDKLTADKNLLLQMTPAEWDRLRDMLGVPTRLLSIFIWIDTCSLLPPGCGPRRITPRLKLCLTRGQSRSVFRFCRLCWRFLQVVTGQGHSIRLPLMTQRVSGSDPFKALLSVEHRARCRLPPTLNGSFAPLLQSQSQTCTSPESRRCDRYQRAVAKRQE